VYRITVAADSARLLAAPASGEERAHEGYRIEFKKVPAFSPTPTNRTGMCRPSSMAKTIPPWPSNPASPARLPVRPTVSWKTLAWAVHSAGRGVEDEEHLGLGPGQTAIDHAANLGQLVHQARPCVEAAGRVGDDQVHMAGDGRVEGVVDDGRWIGAGACETNWQPERSDQIRS